MEKLLDIALARRHEIGDFETVLKLLWIEAADMPELETIDAINKAIQSTIRSKGGN